MMNISDARYMAHNGNNIAIVATVDGKLLGISLDPANRHYAEIMRQVNAGELTIADAE